MHIRRQVLAISSGIALMFTAQGASADIIASLVFTNPTGIVGPNDNVAPWLRFSLDASSDPLDLTDLSTFGWAGLDTVTGVFMNGGFGCSDTFTGGCNSDGHPYRYEWNSSPTEGYPVIQGSSLKLMPGQGVDYTALTFIPNGGPVPAGTYSLPRMQVSIEVFGQRWEPTYDVDGNVVVDADGNVVSELKDASAYRAWTTCPDFYGAGCSASVGEVFQRTVVAVPEPETYATMLAGLGLLGFLARRRKS